MNNFKDSLIIEQEQPDYKKQTFSGYKKTQVMTKLKQCILKQEIDRACIWGIELDISGHTFQLWEDLIIYALTEINIINPNLPIYLFKKYKEFLRIYHNFKDFSIHIRNNQESRNKLCDLIVTIALSPKKKFPKYSKITLEDLTNDSMRHKMIANHLQLVDQFSSVHDPLKVRIAVNEIIAYFKLSHKGTNIVENCFYWIDFIQFYEKTLTKKKQKLLCRKRNHIKETNKFDNDYVWLLWEVILHYSKINKNYKMNHIINCLYNLYILNFTKGKKNKRFVMIKFAILLILDCVPKVNYNTPIFYKNELRFKANLNINQVYANINYNKKHIGYKLPNENVKFVINKSPLFSNKHNENPELNKSFSEYLKQKKFLPSENQIKTEYNKYVKKIKIYNEKANTHNLKVKQIKANKLQQNKLTKNIDSLLKNSLHKKNKFITFKKPILTNPSKYSKQKTKLSSIYKKL